MKKLIATLMAVLMLTMLLAGCAKEDTNNDQPNNDQSQDQQTPSAPQDPAPSVPEVPVKPELTKEEKQAKMVEIITKLMEFEVMMPASMPLDATMISEIYQLAETDYEVGTVQMPMMMVHATEFAIFWAAEGKMDTVLEKIEARQDALVATWERYLPDQFELVQNYKVLVNGDLVVFLICNEMDTISQAVAQIMGEGTEFKTAA